MTDERLARAALSRLTEPATLRVSRALTKVSATRLYEDILTHRGDADLVADASGRLTRLDPARELEQAATRGIRFVIPGDGEWPSQLDDLAHGDPVSDMGGVPIGLWVRGPLRLDELAGSVAVVGSRSATTYGENVARGLGAGIARADRALISGAALGIDQAGHRGALAMGGPSVAVLACGVDRSYPAEHHDLIEHMARERRHLGAAARLRAAADEISGSQPDHRRPHVGDRHRRGGDPERGPQQRGLGGQPQPPPDGCAGAGHQRTVRGRPPLDPERGGQPGQHGRRRAGDGGGLR